MSDKTRPGYPYLNIARAIKQPYGLVLSYVDFLETARKRGGVPLNMAPYWQEVAIEAISASDKASIKLVFDAEHEGRRRESN